MPPVAMISGHLDLTPAEFMEHYEKRIRDAIDHGHTFVVGDARGADTMAQEYLFGIGADVVVYHMFLSPRFNFRFPTKGEFISDTDRDFAMTMDSDYDIAWVRQGREKSGTAKNLERRELKNRILSPYIELVEAVNSESPLRLAATGDLNAAAEYEKRITEALEGVNHR